MVPNPGNPQSLNRYSYCDNNPVNFTDPSGHHKKHHGWWHWLADIGLAIVAVAAAVLLPVTAPGIIGFMSSLAAGAAAGAAIGGVTSSIMGGNWGQGVLTGAIGGAIFGGIGSFDLGAHIAGFGAAAMHFAGGAASGAIDATIQGGNAGVSALINGISAGASDWAGESNGLFKFTGHYMTDVVKQAALGGVIGGAASAAMGGSFRRGFENGAETSAIAFTANEAIHNPQYSLGNSKNNSSLNISGIGNEILKCISSSWSYFLGPMTDFGSVAITKIYSYATGTQSAGYCAKAGYDVWTAFQGRNTVTNESFEDMANDHSSDTMDKKLEQQSD